MADLTKQNFFVSDFSRLAEAAEKLAIAADKAVELMGAAVSQMDEIRAEVRKMNEPLIGLPMEKKR